MRCTSAARASCTRSASRRRRCRMPWREGREGWAFGRGGRGGGAPRCPPDACVHGGGPSATCPSRRPLAQCCVCPVAGGALKQTTVRGLWCHSACLQWIPEVRSEVLNEQGGVPRGEGSVRAAPRAEEHAAPCPGSSPSVSSSSRQVHATPHHRAHMSPRPPCARLAHPSPPCSCFACC